MEKSQTPDFLLKISRVRTANFAINELFVNPEIKEIKIDFQYRLNISLENNLIDFSLRTYYHYENSNNIIVDFGLQNLFESQSLKDFIKETTKTHNKIFLPRPVLVTIVSLSISHSRAVLCQHLAGTMLNDSIIPIVMGEDITNAFFPNSLDGAIIETNIDVNTKEPNIEMTKNEKKSQKVKH
jgi:hypothetical protein